MSNEIEEMHVAQIGYVCLHAGPADKCEICKNHKLRKAQTNRAVSTRENGSGRPETKH